MIIAKQWDGTPIEMEKQQENIPEPILKKSNLSYEETQLIQYIRTHPEEKDEIIKLLKNKKTHPVLPTPNESPDATNIGRVVNLSTDQGTKGIYIIAFLPSIVNGGIFYG